MTSIPDKNETPEKDFWSKTEMPCDCDWLSRAVDEPAVPIEFDVRMNEYHVIMTYSDGSHGHMIVRHCPWCGGTAPKSQRGSFFAHLHDEERQRLNSLMKGIKTVDDVLLKFGEPDEDHAQGVGTLTPGNDTTPDHYEPQRLLRYTGLSEIASVDIIVYPTGNIGFSYNGKYLAGNEQNTLPGIELTAEGL
jgi:hypothetical protein